MVYWGIVAVSQAVNYFRKYQEREFRLAQAQLQALRMQLHPHFLFNTLNAIAELVYSDPKTADRSIVALSYLLRYSLESEKSQEVTLKKELDFLEKYVEIQRTLMRDRLHVRLSVDPEALDARVPNMLLQPLVENAIKHGVTPRAEGGEVSVEIARADGRLRVSVRDDGPGIDADVARASRGNGVGLANTRARLEQLYGQHQRFTVGNHPAGGAMVELVIPLRT